MTETVPVQFQYTAQYSAHNKYSTDGTDRKILSGQPHPLHQL